MVEEAINSEWEVVNEVVAIEWEVVDKWVGSGESSYH